MKKWSLRRKYLHATSISCLQNIVAITFASCALSKLIVICLWLGTFAVHIMHISAIIHVSHMFPEKLLSYVLVREWSGGTMQLRGP